MFLSLVQLNENSLQLLRLFFRIANLRLLLFFQEFMDLKPLQYEEIHLYHMFPWTYTGSSLLTYETWHDYLQFQLILSTFVCHLLSSRSQSAVPQYIGKTKQANKTKENKRKFFDNCLSNSHIKCWSTNVLIVRDPRPKNANTDPNIFIDINTLTDLL